MTSCRFVLPFAFGLPLALLLAGCSGGTSSGSGNNPPPSPTITSVSVSCTPTSVQTGQTSQCSATVSGTGNYSSAVTWSTTDGTISSAGLFTASAVGTASVTATSTQDTTKSRSSAVTVANSTALVITVSDLPPGTLANMEVTDPNGQKTAITASQTISAIAGTYTITAVPVVVGTSTYNAMLPTQTAVVNPGNATSAIVDYKNVVPSTTKVLDSAAMSSLSVSADGLTFTMSASSLVAQALTVGDVIVVPPTSASGAAPMGMLRKVTSISKSSSQVIAITQLGTLSEAFQRLGFETQMQLASSTIRAIKTEPGVTFHPGATIRRSAMGQLPQASLQTLSDPCGGYSLGVFDVSKDFQMKVGSGLSLSGSVELCSGLNFDVDIIGAGFLGLQPQINSLAATASMGESSDLTLQGNLLTGSFNPDPTTLAKLDFPPIEVPGLPVWVTPEVSVFVGANGSISSSVSTEVSSSGTFTGGVKYASGTWSPVPLSPSFQFAYQPPTLDATLSAKAYTGIEFDLYVYDVVGPSFKPDGYLDLEADITKNPWWALTDGIEGPMSLDVAILGESLVSYDLGTMFDYSSPIASASGPFLPNNPVPTITPPLVPASLPAGSAAQMLTIKGTGFLTSSTVTFNGISHAATFNSASQLTISLTSADLAATGAYPVVVTNPAPGGGSTNATFTVTALGVSVTPSSATVPLGAVQTFAATVSGGGGVTWSIQEGAPGGTITSTGIYTVPNTAGTFHVVATSVADSSQSAVAVVTVVAGPNVTTLHSFDHTTEGANPWAALIQGSDGTFYGTTEAGGDLFCSFTTNIVGCGTAFKMDTSGNVTVLHAFSGQDGAYPSAQLTQTKDGSLYGTTAFGGLNISACLFGGTSTPAGCGTVFKVDTSGGFTRVYSFSAFSSPEGVSPAAALIQANDGALYGTTREGGNSTCTGTYDSGPMLGCGSIFQIDSSNSLTTLHSFNETDGAYPTASLLQATDGNFYGVTVGGGHLSCASYATPGCGTVFKMTSPGTIKNLHSFSLQDGAFPNAALIQASDGNLYGTTLFGGNSPCTGGASWQGCGTAFRIDTAGNLTTLHGFSGPDGAYPSQLIQASDGYFYGTTESGGDLSCTGRYGPGCGTLFRMDSSGNVTVLYEFTGQSDGSWSESALIQGTDGNLYGTAVYGGTNDDGVVFRITNFRPTAADARDGDLSSQQRAPIAPKLVVHIHIGLPAPVAPGSP